MTEKSTRAKGGMGKSIAILAAISLVSRMATTITLGTHPENHPGATGRFLGGNLGGAIGSLLVGLIFFFIIRLVRRRSGDPFAGVLGGLLVIIVASYLAYIGELSHISR